MKKSLVFLFACGALSACGGTIEAEEPSTLQSVEQKVEELVCPSTCFCADGCRWRCGKSWNSNEWRYEWFMQRIDCSASPYMCQMGTSVRCVDDSCVPHQEYTTLCPTY